MLNQNEKLVKAMGYETSWPTVDILEKLCDATDVLLHRYDYDGHGWEVLQHCMEEGRTRIKELRSIDTRDQSKA